MLQGIGCEPRHVQSRSGKARCAGGQCTAAEFRHRILGPLGPGAKLADGDAEISASDSSMPSITRCCEIMARRWSISPAIDSSSCRIKGDPGDTTATVRTEVKKAIGRQGSGEFQSAQDSRWVEGLGRGDRRHLLRQELSHRFCLGDPAKGAGRRHQPIGKGRPRGPGWRRRSRIEQ